MIQKMNRANQFLDLEIRIAPRQDDAYPVEIALGNGQEFSGRLAASILPWISIGDSAEDGRKLFQALFTDPALRTAWDQALGQSPQRRIRLRIAADAPELHAIPWELFCPDDATGETPLSANADTPFSRYLPIALPWGGPVEGRPIRVLVVISNPHDIEDKYNLPPADVEVERSAFTPLSLVGRGAGGEGLRVDFLDAPITPERLEEKLRDGYHILHYLGHGAFSAKRGQAVLYVQDDEGHAQLLFDDELAQLLARQGVQPRLVFLAACQNARMPSIRTRSTGDAFRGMAPKLVSVGVPAVVAMQDLVTVESALKFSTTFYQRLLEHGQVDLAVNEARGTLLTAGRPDAAVPVLFMRLKSGQLWEDTETEESSSPGSEPKYNVRVEGGQVGIIGDGAKIEGGIHFGKT